MFATKPYPDTSFYNIHTITTGPQREIFPTTRPTRTSREFLTREQKFFTVSFGHLNVDSSLHMGEFHPVAGISYIKSRDTGTYDGAYIGSVFLTFSKGFIVYFDNSFGCSFGCITVSETLVFFQLNNIFESQN